MKLNIGAGNKKYDGYLNCDYDTHYNPDYVFDMEKDVWPFEDDSVTNIIAHHVLEHMGEGYFHVLKEIYRICKPGAIIDIRVPHWTHHNFYHDPTHRRSITPYGLSLFSKRFNDFDEKRNGNASKLAYFFDVDFEIVAEDFTIDSKYTKILQGQTKQQIFEYAYEKNNIIEEMQIILTSIKGNREEQIKGYYYSLFDREPDKKGLNHHLQSDRTLEEIRKVMVESDEYKNKEQK